jgi:rubrerythrin
MAYEYSAREITQMAMDVEAASSAFYQGLADISQEKLFKDVFRDLSRQEAEHRREFKDMAKDLADLDSRHAYSIDIYNLMKRTTAELKRQRPPRSAVAQQGFLKAALDLAVSAEKGASEVYQLMRDAFGPHYRKLLNGIIKVEKTHLKKVLGLKKKLVLA